VLKKLGFKVDQKGDMVKGELKKHNSYMIQEKLDFLGRLMGAVRLLDMVLDDDRKIDWYRDQFFKGNYTFERKEPNETLTTESGLNEKLS
jgi:pyruvate,water dikinase